MTDSPPRITRRRLIAAAVGTAAHSLVVGPVAAHEGEDGDSDGDHSGGDHSNDDQLSAVTAATEQYADPQAAMDDGYIPLGPFVPGMGWHFLNQGHVQSAVENGFDPEQPQLLTYGDTGAACDGDLVLGAVEYAIPVGARGFDEESPPSIFDGDGGAWHVHHAAEHAFAVPAAGAEDVPDSAVDASTSTLFRTTNWIEVAPGGEPGSPMFEPGTALMADFEDGAEMDQRVVVESSVHPDLWTLHAWAHTENPAGVFAPTNPDLPGSPED
ncbi:hypothetical protein [Halomicrobium urmianum]|uniref:hypothetical protein n=1 Tax=Halomicrobium urmianum TaxID=1586233 RepID=UPI001CD9C2FA|nr:hypothetical protein [Halomicrobium urmianum]